MVDVLVIGGGLAGCIAALELAHGGANVALSRHGWGATAAFNGAFDVALSPALSALGAGAPHGGTTAAAHVAPWSLQKHLDDIISHQPLHPYSTLGPDVARDHILAGYARLQRLLGPWGVHATHLSMEGPCALLPSSSGSLNPAPAVLQALAGPPRSPFVAGRHVDDGQTEGPGAEPGTWGVLDLAASGMPLGPRTQAAWLHDARQFGAQAPKLQHITLDTTGLGPYSGPFHLARHLDDLGHAQTFAQSLVCRVAGLGGLIVPPVLGVQNHRRVVEILQKMLDMPVLEALASMPSVPGVRLMQALEAAVAQAGVRVVSQTVSVTCDRERFTQAHTQSHGALHGDACVLATGRFWAGGLTWPRGERCREQLFGLPVLTSSGPLTERNAMEVTRRRPEEPQPLMTAGIGVDECLRPLNGAGAPLTNVRAAGMVLGGFSPRYSRCADGVALATGHFAAHSLMGAKMQEAAS